jgi:hypothetical protein
MASSFSTHSTRWSLIVRARGAGEPARLAMGELVQRYERTIACHIRRFRCPPGTTPEDEKQAFLAAVLRRNDLARLDPTKGRFRDWLAQAVRYHMLNVVKRWQAESYGNLVTDHPGDFDVPLPPTQEDDCLTAEALDVCDHALQRHRVEKRNKSRFDALARFLPGRNLNPVELAPLSSALGMSKNALSVEIYRMQATHRRIVCELVADSLDLDPSEGRDLATLPAVRLELEALLSALIRVPTLELRQGASRISRSLMHTPAAATRTRTCPGSGTGRAVSPKVIWWGALMKTACIMV